MLYFTASSLALILLTGLSSAGGPGQIATEMITIGTKRCKLCDGCRSRSDWLKDDKWLQCGGKKYPNECQAMCDGYDFDKMGPCKSCDKDVSYIAPYIDLSCSINECSSMTRKSSCSECSVYEECSAGNDGKCKWGIYTHSNHRWMHCIANCGGNKDSYPSKGDSGYDGKGDAAKYGDKSSSGKQSKSNSKSWDKSGYDGVGVAGHKSSSAKYSKSKSKSSDKSGYGPIGYPAQKSSSGKYSKSSSKSSDKSGYGGIGYPAYKSSDKFGYGANKASSSKYFKSNSKSKSDDKSGYAVPMPGYGANKASSSKYSVSKSKSSDKTGYGLPGHPVHKSSSSKYSKSPSKSQDKFGYGGNQGSGAYPGHGGFGGSGYGQQPLPPKYGGDAGSKQPNNEYSTNNGNWPTSKY